MTAETKKTLTQAEAAKKRAPAKAAPKKAPASKKSAPARNSKATTPATAPKSAQKRVDAPKTATKRPRGRPSLKSKEVEDQIIERLASGEPLAQICRDEGMPRLTTVYDWCSRDPSFSERFARARDDGFEAIAVECLTIADNTLIGEEVEESENGMKIKRGDMLGHRKLQIETRLKLLAKWNPKKYGDRVDMNHGTQEGDPIRDLIGALSGNAGSLRPREDDGE